MSRARPVSPQEIKEAVELPLTHPELYEDIGIKPPKASTLALHA